MYDVDDDKPMIINIGEDGQDGCTFGEAFGEFSSANGRKQRRSERKVARQGRKGQRNQNRIVRKQERLDKRTRKGGAGSLENQQSQQSEEEQLGGGESQQGGGESESIQRSQGGNRGGNSQESTQEDSGQYESQEEEIQESGLDNFDDESSDGEDYEGVDGKKRPNKAIRELTRKIVFGREVLAKLEAQNEKNKANLKHGKGLDATTSKQLSQDIRSTNDKIHSTKNRIDSATEQLLDYCKSNNISKKSVQDCKMIADTELKSVKERSNKTHVSDSLDADISKNRIVVNPTEGSSSAEGGDDNEKPKVIELQSGFDGVKPFPMISLKGLAIAIGVTAVAIYLIKRYKVLS